MLEFQFDNRDDLAKELLEFRILFAYHSNKIENGEADYQDTRDIFESGRVTGFTGNPRTHFEILNQKNCHEFLLDQISERKPITIDLTKEIHHIRKIQRLGFSKWQVFSSAQG